MFYSTQLTILLGSWTGRTIPARLRFIGGIPLLFNDMYECAADYIPNVP